MESDFEGGVSPDVLDAFYAAWADDLVHQAVEGLVVEYHRDGKGDWFRVLYGRICEELPVAEIARALETSPAAVEHQYRQARERLSRRLQELVSSHVERYSGASDAGGEFKLEWERLREHLERHGGLESAVRRAADERTGR